MENRFIYSNESDLVKPKTTCDCYTCIYRLKEFKNGYAKACCQKYMDPNCKPLAILFHDKKCEFYKKDQAS